MKAFLRSARIAPKKMSVIAQMVRGLAVPEALEALAHTHKKAARLIETLLKSAVANAVHNAKQRPEELVIRSIVVNQGSSYRRGVPMARGRTRPMRKFLSHVEIVLGVGDIEGSTEERKQRGQRKQKKQRNEESARESSQKHKKMVQRSASPKPETKHTSVSSATSASSVSSN